MMVKPGNEGAREPASLAKVAASDGFAEALAGAQRADAPAPSPRLDGLPHFEHEPPAHAQLFAHVESQTGQSGFAGSRSTESAEKSSTASTAAKRSDGSHVQAAAAVPVPAPPVATPVAPAPAAAKELAAEKATGKTSERPATPELARPMSKTAQADTVSAQKLSAPLAKASAATTPAGPKPFRTTLAREAPQAAPEAAAGAPRDAPRAPGESASAAEESPPTPRESQPGTPHAQEPAAALKPKQPEQVAARESSVIAKLQEQPAAKLAFSPAAHAALAATTSAKAATPTLAPPAAAARIDELGHDPSLRVDLKSGEAHVSLDAGGGVSLHIQVENGVASVRASGAAAPLLAQNLPELRASLGSNGLTLGGFASGSGSREQPEGESADAPTPAGKPIAQTSRRTSKSRLEVEA